MCSKARSPEISLESMRISPSDRNGVVCARQSGASGAQMTTHNRKDRVKFLFIIFFIFFNFFG